jgi:hypothetical protein
MVGLVQSASESACVDHHFVPLFFLQLQVPLFPASLMGAPSAVLSEVCRRCRLLGWLFGKALIDKHLDERLLPLQVITSPVVLVDIER